MQRDDERQMAKRALAKSSCPYCGTIITAHQAIQPGHCDAQNCATVHSIRGHRERETQREQEYTTRQDEARTIFGAPLAQAATAMGRDVDDVLVAVVPFQEAPLEHLSEARRAAFEIHIERIVNEAFAAGPDDISMLDYHPGTPEEPSIVAAGCTACQGFCCKRGGGTNHALLTRQTIFYIRDNDPDLESETVIQHYIDALPDTSVQDACVYQSATGCTLQRKWRSSVCNTFHCHDIHAMYDLTGGRVDIPLIIVGVGDQKRGKVIAFDAISGVTKIEQG